MNTEGLSADNFFLSKRLKAVFLVLSCSSLMAFISNTDFSGINETSDLDKITSVMIDAGHGGSDPGNLGTGKYKSTEKDVTLDVSMKLGKYIKQHFPQVEVLYTRETDSYPTLYDRTEKANKAGVDLFLSIHCDAFTKKEVQGCGSYVMGPAKTEANLKMAQKENAVMLKEKNYKERYSGFDPYSPESYIELSLRQNAFMEQSLSFSDKIQKQFKDRVGRIDRGVKQAPFWVISFTTMPSVLVELGFLTNPEEEKFLQSENGKDLMASALFRAFRDYKHEVEGIEIVENKSESQVEASEIVEPELRNAPKTKKVKGLQFHVQIITSASPVEIKPENFKGRKDVDEYISNGLYKYVVGSESKYENARMLQEQLRTQGFEGAFVVAFENGKRIPLSEAIQMAKK